jgi:hypothetical protein
MLKTLSVRDKSGGMLKLCRNEGLFVMGLQFLVVLNERGPSSANDY